MKICVFGLWHLGAVTSACLAQAGHTVVGLDPDSHTIGQLSLGKPPLFEPNLEVLTADNIANGRLRFTTDAQDAIHHADVVWVTFDTPVDEDDNADVEAVIRAVTDIFPFIPNGAVLLISSQVPVGSTARLAKSYHQAYPDKQVFFGYSPENLRLGKAIEVFSQPDRVVVGVHEAQAREVIQTLFAPITDRIEWMGVESAEMTKHALNAFLATSVVFINEIARICEQVGADAKEVERGLKSESRIGARAYLGPGGAFAGGTLARDIAFLQRIGEQIGVDVPLFAAVETSNRTHKGWAYRRLTDLLGGLEDKTIAVWGLTYKPNTDTLRRSSAIELCRQLAQNGAIIRAYDPKITQLPDELGAIIQLMTDINRTLTDADALVIATEWSDFKTIPAQTVLNIMRQPLVLDANRFLHQTLGALDGIRYYTVGKS